MTVRPTLRQITLLFQTILLFLQITGLSSLHAQSVKPWHRGAFPALAADESLWIGTPGGLYRYQYEEDTWAVIGTHNGLPADDIRLLMWDGEWLWAGTPNGVAAGDVQLNKWLSYGPGNGLPGGNVLALAAETDYVWVGTDRGAARFDKLIQEWETFGPGSGLPDTTVFDIAVDGPLVYFATAAGLAEYDVRFEKWRTYGSGQGIPSDTIRFLYPTTEALWLFTDRGPALFNTKLHTAVPFVDGRLRYSAIRDLAVRDETLWLATDSGVWIYDPSNAMWREFTESANLSDRAVRAFSFGSQSLWFATDRGVTVHDVQTRSWTRVERAQGLTTDRYEAASSFLDRVFLIQPASIDYYRPDENRWIRYALAGEEVHDREPSRITFDREKGSTIRFGEGIRLGLSGTRFTERFNGEFQTGEAGGPGKWTDRNLTRSDLKAQLDLPGKRSLNAFYDDTDPYSQILYGVKFRGGGSDLLQEAGWGDLRAEAGKNEGMPVLGVFGGMARLETGPRTARYRRSFLSARGISGERTTGRETEFFTGNLRNSGAEFKDTQFIPRSFFRIGPEGTSLPMTVDQGSEFVFLDDGAASTNSENTSEGAVVAGISGDFDRLHPFIEYFLDRSSGTLWIPAGVAEGATVAVRGTSGGVPFEAALKTPGRWENLLVNRYSVQGKEILPHSFRMEILDGDGASRPLSEFGLDRNSDGLVDSEFIDCRAGLLSFPGSRPFPASVYDADPPVSRYRMRVRFQTEIPSFSLKRPRLLRGSEEVVVDGERLTAGSDYVLDYTVGTLFILKEGAVAEDSEIRVEYEYIRDTTEEPIRNYRMAGIGFNPSDQVQVELNAFGFDVEGDGGPSAFATGWNAFGEFRKDVRGLDVRFTPQYSADGISGTDGSHVNIRTDVSSSNLRFHSAYEKIDPGYRQLFERKFQLGGLGERRVVNGTVLPFSWMDVGAGWSRQSTLPAGGRTGVEEESTARVLLNRPSWPAFSLSVRKRTLDTTSFRSDKRSIRGDFEYRAGFAGLKAFRLQSFHMIGMWRRSWEESGSIPGYGLHGKAVDSKYLRIDLSPADRIQFNGYYRSGSGESGFPLSHTGPVPDYLNRKIFLTATMDRIEGVNFYLLYQNEISELHPSPVLAGHDLSLDRSLLTTLRVYPGQWISFLSPLTFGLDVRPSSRAYTRNRTENTSFGGLLWSLPDTDAPAYSEDGRTVTFRNEWRPSGLVTVYLDTEKGEGRAAGWTSEQPWTTDRTFGKMEIRPSPSSLITIQFQHLREEKRSYSVITSDIPTAWVEYRWTESLQTRCNISGYRKVQRYERISQDEWNVSPLLGVIYRLSRSATRIELRNDASASFYRNRMGEYRFGSDQVTEALGVDIFPASVLVFRFRTSATYRKSANFAGDGWIFALECRLTAQL
jgi:hypothetical protein